MLSCSTRTVLFDPIHLICHVLNPYNHDPHILANHCTARLPLLSHCLVCIENLLLTLYNYGWVIMLNKKLVDIYYILMMLIYIRRRMEGWTIPVRCFVP